MSINFRLGRTKLQHIRFLSPAPQSRFATFDPERTGIGLVLSNSNLKITAPRSSGWRTSIATVGHLPAQGRKLYAEFRIVGPNNRIMLVQEPYDVDGITENGVSIYPRARDVRVNAVTYDQGTDVLPPEEDAPLFVSMWWDGSNFSWAYNGILADSQSSGSVFSTTGCFDPAKKVYPAAAIIGSIDGDNVTANFGASPWRYSPPAGYEGWSEPPSTGGEMLPPAG